MNRGEGEEVSNEQKVRLWVSGLGLVVYGTDLVGARRKLGEGILVRGEVFSGQGHAEGFLKRLEKAGIVVCGGGDDQEAEWHWIYYDLPKCWQVEDKNGLVVAVCYREEDAKVIVRDHEAAVRLEAAAAALKAAKLRFLSMQQRNMTEHPRDDYEDLRDIAALGYYAASAALRQLEVE